jgi:hypothetical protein
MFRRFFAGREAASPAAKPVGSGTRRSRRSRPGLEDLEGRQLMSVTPQLLVHSPSQDVATADGARKAKGSGNQLRYLTFTINLGYVQGGCCSG